MKIRTIFTLLLTSIFIAVQAQKGDKSIAVGPLLSFPLATESRTGQSDLKPGVGLEAIGQYNLSYRSALLLKMTLASWGYKKGVTYDTKRLTFLSLQSGYKFKFGNSGFFVNGLVGTDTELKDGFTTISFTLGAGKRFTVRDDRFIDAGIDLVGGDAEGRVNFKVIFSLIQWVTQK